MDSDSDEAGRARGRVAMVLGAVMIISAGGVGALAARKTANDVRRGWNLTPALVLVADRPAGHVLAATDFHPREVPGQMTEGAVLPADGAGLIGQKLAAALPTGAVLSRAHL